MDLLTLILPEVILAAAACVLLLLGVSAKPAARRLAPMLALAAVAGVFAFELGAVFSGGDARTQSDHWNTVTVGPMAHYVKLLVAGVGVLLVLLAWPTNANGTGSRSMELGEDVGEFFGLMLLSLAGVFLVAGANDLVLLFLAIELASIPTYVMVSMSRPLAVAQEAGVKYFFLGALAAAVMLFGFSYLYGTTGTTELVGVRPADGGPYQPGIVDVFAATGGAWTYWQVLAVVMTVAGFAFKMAAVPLHAYAGDVYEGAATPVTAFLAFVPKTAGFIALIRVLSAVGGANWQVPDEVVKLLWVVAVLTMSVGNVLGMLQTNIKRLLAYSSVAHTGYMLVAITALLLAPHDQELRSSELRSSALQGVLFYLAAYGIMNAAAFGVLMLLPSRAADLSPGAVEAAHRRGDEDTRPPATTAETFDDLAGQGRRHVVLGLAMAVACFSLIGIPLTVGFWGKFYLIKPALDAGAIWLVVITMANAAVSAYYYLRIVGTMFLRTDPVTPEALASDIAESPRLAHPLAGAVPVATAVGLSVVLTLVFGIVIPATRGLSDQTREAAAAEVSPDADATTPPTAARAALP